MLCIIGICHVIDDVRTGRTSASAAFHMKLIFGTIVLAALIAGGFALFSHVRELNSAVAIARRDLLITSKRLAHIEAELKDLRAAQAQLRRAPASNPPPMEETSVIHVSPGEAEMIREVILNQPGIGPDMKSVATVGQMLQEVSPRPVPIELQSGMPKLRGLRYVLDAHWAIVLIAASTNRVVAVISPV
jgi:hypothetical protein